MSHEAPIIDVVIPSSIDQTFSYQAEATLSPGQRVAVPFGRGNRLTEAFVVACPSTKPPTGRKFKLKSVAKIIDAEPLLTPAQWQLASWLSRYYMYPLADVLKAMIPGALAQQDDLALTPLGLEAVAALKPLLTLTKKRRQALLSHLPSPSPSAERLLATDFETLPLPAEVQALRAALGSSLASGLSAGSSEQVDPIVASLDRLAQLCDEPLVLALALVFGRKPILRLTTARTKLAATSALWPQPPAEIIAHWQKAELTAPYTELKAAQSPSRQDEDQKPSSCGCGHSAGGEPAKILTARQQEVFDELVAGLGLSELGEASPQPVLLHGITGSGKTELYLQLIAQLRRHHPEGQTLVLVPEIGLTPQMETRFDRRFPGEVALVHSALSKGQRWSRLEAIKSGQRSILIGPRSAVLAGFADLKLIIADEEHDSSYKQGTGFLYHGRDVAIVRAKQQHAAVVLGSATPSLESYQNARSGRYRYLPLMERASGVDLPEIKVIKGLPSFSLKEAVSQSKAGGPTQCYVPIATTIIEAIKATIAEGQQVIVIVNRKGYSSYLMTKGDKEPVTCPHCAITLKVYNHNALLRCHYCDYRITVAAFMARNPGKEYLSVGYGSDKVFDYLGTRLGSGRSSEQGGGARLAAVDADTPKAEFHRSLRDFRAGKVDVLVGTQILAKGHDFPKVTLTVVLEVDHLLNLPDFRGGERTFQLLVQAAGRSGRDKRKGRVLFQTLQPGHPVISAALSQDYLPFAQGELAMREDLGFPPFARLALIECHSAKVNDIALCKQRIQGALAAIGRDYPNFKTQLTVSGPSAPPIEKVRGRHRLTLLLRAKEPRPLWQMVALLRHHLDKLPASVVRRVDIDPQSLL